MFLKLYISYKGITLDNIKIVLIIKNNFLIVTTVNIYDYI